MDLPLDSDGDLDVAADGTLTLIMGPDEVAQKLRIRFRFFKGEFFGDARLGTPWFQDVLRHHPSEPLMRAVFRRVILGCPGVASIDSLTTTWDRATRQVDVHFRAILAEGGVLDSTDLAAPFIVEV